MPSASAHSILQASEQKAHWPNQGVVQSEASIGCQGMLSVWGWCDQLKSQYGLGCGSEDC